MLTQDQITKFVEAADEAGYGIDENDVDATRDTLSQFEEHQGAVERKEDTGLHIWFARKIRGQKRDLLVMDFGDVRATTNI